MGERGLLTTELTSKEEENPTNTLMSEKENEGNMKTRVTYIKVKNHKSAGV